MLAVLAFSLDLSDRIKTYGGYAGFAAIIGLAVLAVLYFAQAREVKRLREWAGRGPERAAEAGARVSADAQKRIVAAPLARPDPITPAGQSAPPPATVTPATPAALGTAAAVAGTEGTGDGSAEAKPGETPAGDDKATDGADATAPGASGAATVVPTPETPPVVPAPGNGEAKDTQTSTAMAPIPASARMRASATPPARTARAAAESGDDGDSSPSRTRWIIAGVVGVLVIVVVVVLLSSGGGAKPKLTTVPTTSTPTPSVVTSSASTKHASAKHAPPRASVTVFVLNGTTVNGLAKTIATKLGGAGFDVPPGNEKTASDQTHSATIIAYAPGKSAAALAVAKTLGLGRDALTPIDADTTATAGPGMTVVVTVGADLTR
jgi:LytR cell envelope-related transcriptional attenuator